MAEITKTLNTRIALKVDTLENWQNSTIQLMPGEIAIATVAADAGNGLTEPVTMIKIGEGGKTFNELGWNFYAKASDVLAACKSEATLKTFINGVINNAGIATDEALTTLAGRVTTVEGAITTLNGDANTDGSVAKKIADAITALDLANTYAAKTHTHTKSDITDFAHTHEMSEVNGLSDAIKDAKKAGTDANTALEAYKVTNDARVKAVEDDIAEINDGTNGVLAQAKNYSDGKLATARTEITAEIDGDVKVVNDALEAYKTSNNAALAGVKATADAAAVKTEVETALAGKEDKANLKALAYKDVAEKTDLAADVQTSLGLADTALQAHQDISHLATKTEAQGYANAKDNAIAEAKKAGTDAQADVDALETLVGTLPEGTTATTVVGYVDAKTANIASDERVNGIEERVEVIEGDYLKAADIANFETKENVKKVADDLADYKTSNDAALAEVSEVAEAATTVDEVNAQIDTKITALNLATTYEPIGAENRAKGYVDQKFTDANLAQYTTEQEVKDIVDGVIAGAADSETYNSLTKLVDYIDAHGGEAADMAEAIETLEGKVETIEGKPAYDITDAQITNWDNEVGAKALAETKTTTAEVKTQIEAYGYATEADLTLAENRITAIEGKEATWNGKQDALTTEQLAAVNSGINATKVGEYDAVKSTVDTNKATWDKAGTALQGVGIAIQGNTAVEVTDLNFTEEFSVGNGYMGRDDRGYVGLSNTVKTSLGKADTAVQTVTADTGLKATKTGTDVAIAFDDTVTFILDCGNSTGNSTNTEITYENNEAGGQTANIN